MDMLQQETPPDLCDMLNKIRKAKDASGLTNQELADIANISYNSVCTITGCTAKQVTLVNAAALCAALGISLDELAGLRDTDEAEYIHSLELDNACLRGSVEHYKRVGAVGRKPKSRGNGTGSVYKRGSGWTVVIVEGYIIDENGKVHRKTRSKAGFKTKKEAIEYIPILKRTPASKAKNASFTQMYEAWLPTHRAGKNTINCYKSAYKYFEAVYHLNLRDIEIEDLQECIDECPHGRRTKENMRALCGLIYKYAIPRHYAELNYGQYLNVDGKHSSRPGLPDDALPKLKAHVNGVFGASYVICQCYLGYRPTEFVALDASQYIRAERAFINGIKTEAGIDRIVTISPKIQPYIDALLPPGKTSGAVFIDKDGKAFTVERYRALFYNVLEACGIDNPTQERDGKTFYTYTPHSCRHTFATLMKRVKGADKDKLELIGHTSDDMLRYYQDVNYADLRKITNAL